MRSGIPRRWLRGSLLITVLLVLLAEAMFLYSYTRSYYNSVQQTMYRRFSSVSGQLKMYTGDTAQSTAATRSVALRRMVEQFADKDKYEFMLLDSYGGVIASSSGTDADGIVTQSDFEQAQDAVDGMGVALYKTQSGEQVMSVCYLVPYAAEDVAAMLDYADPALREKGFAPYYLYRQKNTLQNLENVGWCKPGHEGYYNIYIMEEVQTILSAGAGGSTKLVADGGRRMQRIFNFKYPTEYIQRFAEVLERKKGVADFYDHDLGTETSG